MSSSKHSRHTPSPSSPPPHHGSSKLPKFLQKQSTRDRSKSVNDGPGSSPEISATPSASSSSKHPRKGSKFLGTAEESAPTESEETPVIIEPVPIPSPRQRQRPDRPTSSELPSSTYTSTSPSRIGDLPTRLSGWFSHTFSSSSTDLSLPTLIAQTHSPPSNSLSTGSTASPRNRLSGASALLTAAKHGKGHLDKAMRYLLDSDATPDKCTDPIWLLGVQHTGYEPPQPQQHPPSAFPSAGGTLGRRGSTDARIAHLVSSSSYASDPSPPSHHGHKRSRSRGQHASSASSSSHSNPNSQFLSQSQPASSPQPQSLSSSVSSYTAAPNASAYNPNSSTSSTHSINSKDPKHPGANWPPVFYADFTSRVWLTYRSHFTPIRDGRLNDLAPPACEPLMGPRASSGVSSIPNPTSPSTFSTSSATSRRTSSRYTTDSYISDSSLSTNFSNNSSRAGPGSPTSTVTSKKWGWGGLGGEKGWTSDSGWGCMLRTGQSLLANALVFMHLGRDWRRPPSPEMTREYAMYVQIVTWFLDTPAEQAPFSVHRMALAGKELGKDVGMWFGPSTAAGAIKTLVHAYPDAGMGVSVATDGTLYQTDVYAASHGASSSSYPRRGKGIHTSWGDRPVLLLLGIRLGLDGVNPIYYDTIKLLYTFPQSVGIAGGRPSSSYYFVGSQADNLFYLDPHHARPAVPLRPPPNTAAASNSVLHPPFLHLSSGSAGGVTDDGGDEREKDKDKDKDKKKRTKKEKHPTRSSSGGSITSSSSGSYQTTPASPSSVRTGSSFHAPLSPSPLQQQYSRSSHNTSQGSASASTSSSSHPPSRTESPIASPPTGDMDMSELTTEMTVPSNHELTPIEEHYATAYSPAELKTFHCERVRKMPMSGLDPSMLIGFLCRDEKDWVDFRKRVGGLPKTIFSIQDEPPTWAADSDDNMGLESMSDPDEIDLDNGDGDGDADAEDPNLSIEGGSDKYYNDSRSRSASLSLSSASQHGGVDTEEDPVDPITPGPTAARFDIPIPKGLVDEDGGPGPEGDDDGDDIEDDWVEPSLPNSPVHTPPPAPLPPAQPAQTPTQQVPAVVPVPALAKSRSVSGSSGSGSTTKNSKKKGKGKSSSSKSGPPQIPVPVPKVKISSRSPAPASAPRERESFPFPVAVASEEEVMPMEYAYSYSSSSEMSGSGMGEGDGGFREMRMHTARARDGGRTQSGGVKGVLTDDW